LGERSGVLARNSILDHGLCIPHGAHHCKVENTRPACLQGSAKEPPECEAILWGKLVAPEPSLAIIGLMAPMPQQSGRAIEICLGVLHIGLIGTSARWGFP
jgi:hypothetical protein